MSTVSGGVDEPHDHESVYDDRRRELGRPVDPPDRRPVFAELVARTDNRRPIVPATLRNRDQRRALYRWAVRLGLHTSAYHATRTPKYAWRVSWYAPRGALRLTAKTARWALDGSAWWAEQEAIRRRDLDALFKAVRMSRAPRRLLLVGVLALLAACSGVLTYFLAPAYVQVPLAVFTVLILARVGRPLGQPITDRVVTGPVFRKLTAEMCRRAILATGKVKDPAAITFPQDIARDGPGQVAILDLPDGVIATDIIDKREHLGGGFRLPHDQVWPEMVRGEHPGRLRIWVADRPVSTVVQPPWPLLEEGTADYFAPFPYGFDIRLRQVDWRLDERNSLFGGIPGSGKSLAARNVLLGAVLDPLVIPVISELKGSGDFDMFAELCPKGLYISGADQGSIAKTLPIIEWLHELCEERGPLIAKYASQGLNTVKKVNRAMAERDERLRPVVALFDEVQEFMSSPLGIKGAGAPMLLSVIKRARALGIHVIVATQRFDKDSIPKAISSLVTNRACLAVPAQPETDMVLGTSAYRTGARPNMFVPGDDSGWMVRAGFTAGYETIRAAYVDDKAAEAVCQRALALRSGEAAPVQRVQAFNLLEDVRRVLLPGEDALWSELILPRLAELRPEVYGEWDVSTFGAAMRAAGCPTSSIHRKIDGRGVTRYGVKLEALEAVLRGRAIE